MSAYRATSGGQQADHIEVYQEVSDTTAVDSEELKALPLADLLRRLADDTSTLVRQELELAKSELTQKGRELGAGAGMLGGAGVVGFVALQGVAVTIGLLLALVMAAWLAALIVTLLFAAGAGILAMNGKKRVQQALPPVPEQTAETLKEDAQWAKTQMQSANK